MMNFGGRSFIKRLLTLKNFFFFLFVDRAEAKIIKKKPLYKYKQQHVNHHFDLLSSIFDTNAYNFVVYVIINRTDILGII